MVVELVFTDAAHKGFVVHFKRKQRSIKKLYALGVDRDNLALVLADIDRRAEVKFILGGRYIVL